MSSTDFWCSSDEVLPVTREHALLREKLYWFSKFCAGIEEAIALLELSEEGEVDAELEEEISREMKKNE